MHLTGSTPFGDRVKQARIAKRMSVVELSAECGIASSRISGYENRGSKPTFYGLLALAQALDCSLDFLCGLKENP